MYPLGGGLTLMDDGWLCLRTLVHPLPHWRRWGTKLGYMQLETFQTKDLFQKAELLEN